MVKVIVSLPLWQDMMLSQNRLTTLFLTGMVCQAKTSYIETEIERGARFEPCMALEKEKFRVDLRRFHTQHISGASYAAHKSSITYRPCTWDWSSRNLWKAVLTGNWVGTTKKTTLWNHQEHVHSLYTTFCQKCQKSTNANIFSCKTVPFLSGSASGRIVPIYRPTLFSL